MRDVFEVDHAELAHAAFELAQAGVDELLALLGGVVFGIFGEVSEGDGLFDFGGELGGEFVFELANLLFELFFDVFGHGSFAVPIGGLWEGRPNGKGRLYGVGGGPSRAGEGLGTGLEVGGWWEEAGRSVDEEGVEEEDGGDLIDGALALEAVGAGADGAAGAVEQGVGFGGGEALVQAVEADLGVELGELVGEVAGFLGLGAYVAGEVHRVADDEVGDGVTAKEATDGFEVEVGGFTVEGEKRLSEDAEGVGDGDADAAVADVEGEDALGGGGLVGLGIFRGPWVEVRWIEIRVEGGRHGSSVAGLAWCGA